VTDPVHYFRILEGEPPPGLSQYAPFRAVVVIDAPYSASWQDQVRDWLVESGCLYMCAWGPGCASWDDSVDYAQIRKYPDGASEDDFVMTTWHENETLEEVFWYAGFCASHPFRRLDTVIIDISTRHRADELLRCFEEAQRWTGDEDEASTSVT